VKESPKDVRTQKLLKGIIKKKNSSFAVESTRRKKNVS